MIQTEESLWHNSRAHRCEGVNRVMRFSNASAQEIQGMNKLRVLRQ